MSEEEADVWLSSSRFQSMMSRIERLAMEAGKAHGYNLRVEEEEHRDDSVVEKLDQLEERLSRLEEEAATTDYSEEFRDRIEQLQEDFNEFYEVKDEEIELVQNQIEKLGDRYEELAEKHNSFVGTATESLQEQNQRISDIEESLDTPERLRWGECSDSEEVTGEEDSAEPATPPVSDEEKSQEQETEEEPETGAESEEEDESEDDGLECPQCGDDHDSISALATHTARSEDHVNIIEFFENEDGVYECVFCGQYENRNDNNFNQHVAQIHGISLTELYLENYEELAETTRVDDEGFNANGNIPELHQVKHIESYDEEKIGEIVADFLDDQDRAFRVNSIAEDVFGQELEATSSRRSKLTSALNSMDRIEKRDDPYDARRNAYYTGESKQVVEPE